MVFTYSEEALKIAIAQLAHNVGWHGIGSNSFEILIDVTARFMKQIAKTSSCVANQYNRTQVNFDDLRLAFNYLGISVNELEDYYKHVDAIPFVKGSLANYPVTAKGVKRICYPDPTELKARAEFYEEWMPSIKLDTEDDSLLNSKIAKDSQLDDSLNGAELTEEEMDRRYLCSLKSQVGADEKIGGFTELSALVPNYIYLSDGGEALSFGGKGGKLPDSKFPPLTKEDLERIQQEEERKKLELQKEKTFQPLKIKINNKEKFRKYLKDSKLKNDYMSKELLKRAKKDKKLKPKLNLSKLSIKMPLNPNSLHKEKEEEEDDEDSLKQKQDLIETAEKLGLSNEINEIKKLNRLKERTQKEKKVKILKEEDLEKQRRKRERMRKKQEELERKQRLREERRQRKEAKEREKEEKRKARERKRLERLKAKEKKGPRKPRTPKKNKQNSQSRADMDDTNSNFSMNSSQTNSLRNNTSTNSALNEYDEKEAANILVSLSEDKKTNKRSTNKRQRESKVLTSPIISSDDDEDDDDDDDDSFKDDELNSLDSSISSSKSKEKFKSKSKSSDSKKGDGKQNKSSTTKDTNQSQPAAKPTFKSLAERKAMPPEILASNKKQSSTNDQSNNKNKKVTKLKKRKNEGKNNSELDKLFEPTFTIPTIKKKEKKPKKKFNDDYIETSSSSSSSDDERALISKKKDGRKKKKKDDASLPKLTVKLPSRTNSPILSPKSSKKDKLKDKKDEKKLKKDLAESKVNSKLKDKKDEAIKEPKKTDKLNSSSNKLNNSKLAKSTVEQPSVENRPKKKAKVIITPTKAARKEAAEKGCVLVTQTVSTNEADDKVWYCPSCSKPDDGSPMIGCDNCDRCVCVRLFNCDHLELIKFSSFFQLVSLVMYRYHFRSYRRFLVLCVLHQQATTD